MAELDLAELERDLARTQGADPSTVARIYTSFIPHIPALVRRLREAEDRLAILNDPGTVEAILQGMWDYAETKGHPKASSSHALGYLINLIEVYGRALDRIADLAEQGEHTSGAAPIARAALGIDT